MNNLDIIKASKQASMYVVKYLLKNEEVCKKTVDF